MYILFEGLGSERTVIGIYSNIALCRLAVKRYKKEYKKRYLHDHDYTFGIEEFNVDYEPTLDIVPYVMVYKNGKWEYV